MKKKTKISNKQSKTEFLNLEYLKKILLDQSRKPPTYVTIKGINEVWPSNEILEKLHSQSDSLSEPNLLRKDFFLKEVLAKCHLRNVDIHFKGHKMSIISKDKLSSYSIRLSDSQLSKILRDYIKERGKLLRYIKGRIQLLPSKE